MTWTSRSGLSWWVLTTLLPFAAGSAVLAPAARHSRRWVHVVMAAAAVVAGGPLSAHDTATGALLAGDAPVTGAAFVATAATVRER